MNTEKKRQTRKYTKLNKTVHKILLWMINRNKLFLFHPDTKNIVIELLDYTTLLSTSKCLLPQFLTCKCYVCYVSRIIFDLYIEHSTRYCDLIVV